MSQFEDSEDDVDKLDADEELSYRRDSVYSCVSLPYFHSFLYIKGTCPPLLLLLPLPWLPLATPASSPLQGV